MWRRVDIGKRLRPASFKLTCDGTHQPKSIGISPTLANQKKEDVCSLVALFRNKTPCVSLFASAMHYSQFLRRNIQHHKSLPVCWTCGPKYAWLPIVGPADAQSRRKIVHFNKGSDGLKNYGRQWKWVASLPTTRTCIGTAFGGKHDNCSLDTEAPNDRS